MIFTEDEIAQLLQARAIARFPHPAGRGRAVETFCRTAVREVCAATGTVDRTEWDHYGSGYASFVDAWFYHPDGRARRSPADEHHAGVFVLLSRLTGTYAMGEGTKAWSAKSASSYLPHFDAIDVFDDPVLAKTAASIDTTLTRLRLKRLHRSDLEPFISVAHQVPTILSERPHRVFDALFYWAD